MTVIEFRPSRLLAMILVALHLAAAFSFLLGFGFGQASAVGWLVLAGSGWHCWRHCRRVPERLGLLEDGALLFDPDGPLERRLNLLPASVVTYPAIWLVWRIEGGRESGALMLLGDQLAPQAWTELQVWLRLRARMRLGGGPQGSP